MKKRKRYQPKTFDGIPPHMIAIMKTSRRSLTVNEIDKAIGPLLKYIDHLKAGTANETDLWAACCTNYLMVELVLILQSTKIQADDAVQEIARIKLSIARDYFVNHVSETLEAQQIRKKQHWPLRSHRRRNQNTRIRRQTSKRNIKPGRLRPLNPSPRPNRAATEQTNQRHKPQKSKTATKTKPLTIQRPSEISDGLFHNLNPDKTSSNY